MFNGRAGVPLSSSCSDSYGNGDVLNEIESFLGSSSAREPRVNSGADIPPVDISTFCSVLGTKFFCFDPCDFGYVTEEIVSYLTAPNTDVNFDHDDAVHAWKCYENVEFESSVFTIALFEDCTKEKIYVKFHRLSGSCSIFSNSVDRFARLACVACDLNQVDPIDRSEKRVTIESIDESGKKKRKGAFKAMPLPLSLKRRAVTCPEFLAYCEIFNVWAHSDIPECLTSMLTSMPKVWKDLLDHHESVGGAPSTEAMGELVTMFASINKIYKNLCAIAVQSHNSMLSVEHSVPVSGLEALSLENAAAHPAVIITDTTTQSHDPSSYDYLDYDEVDGSAGYADDTMFGAHAAANNFAHRTSVTLDVTKSHHRSMAVFEQDSSVRFTAVKADSAAKAPLAAAAAAAAAPTFEVQLGSKKADSAAIEAKYAKFLQPAAASPCGAATAEVCQFATLLTNKSREELSTILYLALACICDQFSSASATEAFNQQHYLTHLLKSNTEFISVLAEIAHEQSDPRVPVNSFGSYRSKDIKLYANKLSSLL